MAEMILIPVLLRVVRLRLRFAPDSRNCPPSSSKGVENLAIGIGPSPTSLRNQRLFLLMLVSDTFRYLGASTASAISCGGVT